MDKGSFPDTSSHPSRAPGAHAEDTLCPAHREARERQTGSRAQIQAVAEALAVALHAIRARRLDYEAANQVVAGLITLHRALCLPLAEARQTFWWSDAVYAGTPESYAPPSAVRIAAGAQLWTPVDP
jgi:hypothetical protein